MVTAHGSGTPQLVNVAAGPYRLWVWSLPDPVRLGEMHISVAVTPAAPTASTSPPIALDVQIRLEPIDATSQPVAQKASQQTRLFQEYYEADFMLLSVGQWNASITINGPDGAAMAHFPFTVLPPHQFNWTIVQWLALAFAGVIGAIWIRRSAGLANPPN